MLPAYFIRDFSISLLAVALFRENKNNISKLKKHGQLTIRTLLFTLNLV
jgi:hypothetical protein